MKKIYYLGTCDTCKRIIHQWEPAEDVVLQELKKDPVTAAQLDALHQHSGSYEALFNKRARLYRERGLSGKELSEQDYRDLILEHYSFLKRPVVQTDDAVFAGNSKKVVAAAHEALRS